MFAQTNIEADTGFAASTVQYIWDKYNAWNGSVPGTFGGQLSPPIYQKWRRCGYLVLFLMWVHLGLTPARTNQWHVQHVKMPMSTETWRTEVVGVGHALANIISEIDYDRRLDLYNHAPLFKYYVTALVDTLPIYVPHPSSFAMRKLLYQPKYKACVFKMQLGVNFLGQIVLWTGPHLGVTSDKEIWESTWAEHPFFSWEWWLADLGYVGALGLLTKYKRRRRPARNAPPPPLLPQQQLMNNVHEHVRNRIENIVGRVKRHALLRRGHYRGDFTKLKTILQVIGHMTAAELNHVPCFAAYGPWRHFY